MSRNALISGITRQGGSTPAPALWQVCARCEADSDRGAALDLDYIDRWSLWLDLKILRRTVPTLWRGR